MTITVAKLHKILGDMIDRGHARKPICIEKTSFYSALEGDGAVIIGVEEVKGPQWVPNADEDGGQKFNEDGSESGRMTVILRGNNT